MPALRRRTLPHPAEGHRAAHSLWPGSPGRASPQPAATRSRRACGPPSGRTRPQPRAGAQHRRLHDPRRSRIEQILRRPRPRSRHPLSVASHAGCSTSGSRHPSRAKRSSVMREPQIRPEQRRAPPIATRPPGCSADFACPVILVQHLSANRPNELKLISIDGDCAGIANVRIPPHTRILQLGVAALAIHGDPILSKSCSDSRPRSSFIRHRSISAQMPVSMRRCRRELKTRLRRARFLHPFAIGYATGGPYPRETDYPGVGAARGPGLEGTTNTGAGPSRGVFSAAILPPRSPCRQAFAPRCGTPPTAAARAGVLPFSHSGRSENLSPVLDDVEAGFAKLWQDLTRNPLYEPAGAWFSRTQNQLVQPSLIDDRHRLTTTKGTHIVSTPLVAIEPSDKI